jgi:hypothetical protein
MEPDTTPAIKKKRFFKRYARLFLVLLIVGLVVSTIYFYRKANAGDAQIKASIAEVQSLTKKVGKLMVLPADETPTVATVSDPEALRDQTFFADAKKGDKVLIYSNAKKAILYDPAADKIITIAPLNTDAAKSTTPATTETKPETKPATTTKKN